MTGETDLKTILASLAPALDTEEFVYCSFKQARYGDHQQLQPIVAVAEGEGLTLVIPRAKADAGGIGYESVFRRITLQVHSSLDAVGLTAAFATRLTEHGISANVIAGFYHDHIFVQAEQAENALAAISELSR